jgi:histidine triad (HIT) family protein
MVFAVTESVGEVVNDKCIFCRIAWGELGTEFLVESEHNVAFRDLAPQAPVHVLVAPRKHFPALRAVGPEDGEILADALLLAARVAAIEGILDGGYRVITNDGSDAGQTVPHLHFHVLGGKPLRPGLA